jgi:hypothetical protein
MSGFDLLSRLFALLLGLAVCEVLKGFARIWRIAQGAEAAGTGTEAGRIGWLVPLLGLLLLLDQTTFWFDFNQIGPHLPANAATLFGLMAVIGTYYAVATFVVPPEPARWPDLDDYYMQVRRTVVGGMLAINLAVLAVEGWMATAGVDVLARPAGDHGPVSDAADTLAVLAVVGLLLVRSRRGSLVLLLLANLLMLVGALPV